MSLKHLNYLHAFLYFILVTSHRISCETANTLKDSSESRLSTVDTPCHLLLATLDGSLIGVDIKTGSINWKLDNEPVVKVPAGGKSSVYPVLVPDPKDGSLYLVDTSGATLVKKLPFSVAELVAAAPCRSSDGIFYSGSKTDAWFSVDPITGSREPLFSKDAACPAIVNSNRLLVARTEYTIKMFDTKHFNSQWNVTYYDYSAQMLPPEELNSYGYLHVSGSSSGIVKTLDRLSGIQLWETDVGSPLVAVYLAKGQDMFSLPFKSIADPVLDALPSHPTSMFSTLYIGEHKHGLYAFPALVDGGTRVLPNYRPPMLLIDGPYLQGDDRITLGHYQLPSTSQTRLQITGRSDPVIVVNSTEISSTRQVLKKNDQLTETVSPVPQPPYAQHAAEHRMLLIVVALLFVFVIAMFIYFHLQVRDMQQQSSRGSNSGSNQSNASSSPGTQSGVVTVGKISFHTKHVLGKGCDGTFVFRGEFDGREVAVKRVLPDCFSLADREVALLRESDTHPNVVRYFCTETDPQFCYIALELASATLQDYVEKRAHIKQIAEAEILHQATCGLEHLHSLHIVHRDVKPANILLRAAEGGQVRAMISDFGLCKKLQAGRASFSRKSGIAGTDGWIAPEMMSSDGRTMCSVDIFSLGCVFYYVISGGKHPFGPPLSRQANILSSEFRIAELENGLWYSLVSAMLQWEPEKRPSSAAVKRHPAFWSPAQTLAFLQDVSDRMEKEGTDSEPLRMLEAGGERVYGLDWRSEVEPAVASDLRKYRSYRGDSLRDLLRAIRNKKHHLRELEKEAQELLGHTAESMVGYWTQRFPRLVVHTWLALQPLAKYGDPLLSPYYASGCFYHEHGGLPSWLTDPPSPKKESEKDVWLRNGRENGAWRPRNRARPRRRPSPS